MTNIPKKGKHDDVHSHITQAREIIERYLPKFYGELVINKLPNTGVTRGTIRNVRRGFSDRLDVLNAMVEVALENKQVIENLKKKIQEN